MSFGDLAILPDLVRFPDPLRKEIELPELHDFLQRFSGVFSRSDQMNRFRAYIQGLLVPGIRKNVENIASVVKDQFPQGFDPAQALQHFVTSSPWPEQDLSSRLKEILESKVPDPDAFWLIHEGTFEKRGKSSVGVQRQYSRQSGKKQNCQVAIILARLGPRGYFPLTARLYLPSTWIDSQADMLHKLVPETNRQLQPKARVALDLLENLGTNPVSPFAPLPKVVVESSYSGMPGFEDQLLQKGFHLEKSPEFSSSLTQGYQHFDWMKKHLGIDHFEGRTWRGWHHHVHLVFTAFAFHGIQVLEVPGKRQV